MSYSGDPGSSTLDEVRFLLGDTDESNELLTDFEIEHLVNTYTTAVRAAYQGALALMARFAGKRDIAVGSARKTYGATVDRYKELSVQLAEQGGNTGNKPIGPAWTGVDVSDSSTYSLDWDTHHTMATDDSGSTS